MAGGPFVASSSGEMNLTEAEPRARHGPRRCAPAPEPLVRIGLPLMRVGARNGHAMILDVRSGCIRPHSCAARTASGTLLRGLLLMPSRLSGR